MKKIYAATSAFATQDADFYIYVSLPRALVGNYCKQMCKGHFFRKICYTFRYKSMNSSSTYKNINFCNICSIFLAPNLKNP